MKKYIICMSVGLFMFSCSQNKKNEQQNVENTVENYIKNQLEDVMSYEKIMFDALDSLQFQETKLYESLMNEKTKAELDVTSFKAKLNELKDKGTKESDKLYVEAKDNLEKAETKLDKINQEVKDYENRAKDRVYSINYKYKAQKLSDTIPVIYEEVFYIDEYGNVMEEEYIWVPME